MTRTFSSSSTPSISLSSCGTMVFSTSEETPGAAGAEERVHLVEEHDDRRALAGLLAGPLEDQPDVPLGLADVLVEQLGALDVEEVGLALLPPVPACRDLLGQRVGDRLGDQRLAAAGRAVEQHALGRLELVLHEQLGVQVGQLDGVADRLDLAEQPTDLGVVDVRDLFEDELLDLGLRAPSRRRSRSGCRAAASRRRGSSGSSSGSARRTTRSSSALAMTRTRSPSASSSLNITTSPTFSNSRAATTLSASLSMTSWPRCEAVEVDARAHVDAQLAAAGEDVDRVVVVAAQEGAEAGRRLGQPVDLLLELHDLVAGLAQGLGQALVLRRQRRPANAGRPRAGAPGRGSPTGSRSTGAGGRRPRPPGTGPAQRAPRGCGPPHWKRHRMSTSAPPPVLRPYLRDPTTGVVISGSWSRFGRDG